MGLLSILHDTIRLQKKKDISHSLQLPFPITSVEEKKNSFILSLKIFFSTKNFYLMFAKKNQRKHVNQQ